MKKLIVLLLVLVCSLFSISSVACKDDSNSSSDLAVIKIIHNESERRGTIVVVYNDQIIKDGETVPKGETIVINVVGNNGMKANLLKINGEKQEIKNRQLFSLEYQVENEMVVFIEVGFQSVSTPISTSSSRWSSLSRTPISYITSSNS